MLNDEGMTNWSHGRASFRHSAFVIYLIHIALVALVALEFLDVFVGLLDRFAALLLHNFPQCPIDVLGHTACIAANEKVRALGIKPLPNFGRIFRHFVLNIDLLRLIA